MSSLLHTIKFAESEAKIVPDGFSRVFSASVREEALLKVLFPACTELAGMQVLFFAPLFLLSAKVGSSAILAAGVPQSGLGPIRAGAAKDFGEVF